MDAAGNCWRLPVPHLRMAELTLLNGRVSYSSYLMSWMILRQALSSVVAP